MFIKIKPNPSLIEKFLYELEMLNNVYPLATKQTSGNKFEVNAGIESFLMHARNIIDFLSNNRIKGKGGKDDLTCIDFLDVNQKNIMQITLPSECTETREKIHKHLAHITKTRIAEKIEWDLELIRRTLNEASIKFLIRCDSIYFSNKESLMERINFWHNF